MKSDNSRKWRLELSKEAYDDLVNIQNYTYSQFGERQWNTYSALIDKVLLSLIKHPFNGHERDDIPQGYQVLAASKHLIIYYGIRKTTGLAPWM